MIGPTIPPGALDRTRPPEIGPVPTLRLPERVEFQLENGLDVILVRKARLPIVDIQLQFEGGASLSTGGADAPGAPASGPAGLAAFVADMLDEGAGSHSALELAEAIDQLGASLTSTASRDAAHVRITVLTPRLEPALELMADIVRDPAFADAEVERVRNERRTRALQQRDQPGTQAGHALDEALFGATHPYGQPLSGTPESLTEIRHEALVAHFRAQYRPSRATVVAVGDLSEEELRPLLEKHFGAWTDEAAARAGATAPAAAPPPSATGAAGTPATPGAAASTPSASAAPANPLAHRPRTIYILDRPGSAQSEIRVGRIAVDRGTEAYFPLTVLNTVLGGSFTSRLNLVLREEKGYTYGAGSGFAMRRQPGPFIAWSAVHTPVTDSAVVDFIREIDRLSIETVPDEELERAKNYVALRLPEQFETTGDVADRIAEIALYDLPADFYDGYAEGVMGVTARDVQRVAREYLDAQSMAIVVVGDRAEIEAPLRRLGLGDVIVLEKP